MIEEDDKDEHHLGKKLEPSLNLSSQQQAASSLFWNSPRPWVSIKETRFFLDIF